MNDSIRRNLMSVPASDGIIDLSLRDVHGNPIKRSTANCYVIKEPGQYKFPLVYGNGIKNGKVNNAAFTNNGGANSHDFVDGTGQVITNPIINNYWIPVIKNSDLTNTTTVLDFLADEDDIKIHPGKDGLNYICIDVKSVPGNGANIIISLRDSYDDYNIWNWHIWLWPHDLTPVEITNAKGVKYNIMPVNLATVLDTADSINKTTGWKSWFYQFGRPVPLAPSAAYNSNSDHNKASIVKTTIATKLSDGLTNPIIVYKHNVSYNYNWFKTNSSKTYNLWDAARTSIDNNDYDVVKTIYDPCPVGFKIPNGNEFTNFHYNNTVGSFANGWKFKRYSGDTVGVFFPASGCRNSISGSLLENNTSGFVWYSSAYSEDYAYCLKFDSRTVSTKSVYYRGHSFSVRPVQDYDTEVETIIKDFVIADYRGNEIILQYEVGMTWFEWVHSEYNNVIIQNTVARTSPNGAVVFGSDWCVYNNDGIYNDQVYMSDKITSYQNYMLIYG